MKIRTRNFRSFALIVFFFTITTSFQGCGDIHGILNGSFASKASPGNGQGYEGLSGGGANPAAPVTTYILTGDCADQGPESIITVDQAGQASLVRASCLPLSPALQLPASAIQIDGVILMYLGNGYLRE